MPDELPPGYTLGPPIGSDDTLPVGYTLGPPISGPVAGGPDAPAAFQKPIPLAARAAEAVVTPLVMQGGGAIGGTLLGGPAGGIAGAGAGSVASDAVNAELNHLLFGRPDPHWSAEGTMPGFQHRYGALEESAAVGGVGQALTPSVGRVLGAVTGTTAAANAARTAAEEQGQQNLAERAAAFTGPIKEATSETGGNVVLSDRLKQAADVHEAAQVAQEKAQEAVASHQTALSGAEPEQIEAARAEVAPQEAERQRGQLVTRTPEQTQAGEAIEEEPYSERLANTKRSYFDPYTRIREARQAPYEQLLGPIRNNPVGPDAEKRLRDLAENLTSTPGQRIQSTNLKDVLNRFKTAGEESDIRQLRRDILSGKRATQGAGGKRGLGITNREWALLKGESSGEEPLTFGELSQLKSRAGAVLRTSTDPTERSVAHQIWDTADNELNSAVEVPQNVKDSYATYKANFPVALSQKIAKARTPAEIGEAIFSGPPQVGLQIVKNTKPEELANLRDAFADYVNTAGTQGKPLPLAQIGTRTNPQVLRALYGDTVYGSTKAWIETEPKAIQLQTLLDASPQAKQDFSNALNSRMQQLRTDSAMKLRKVGVNAAYSLGPQGKAIANELYLAKTPQEIEAAAQKLANLAPQDVVKDMAAKSIRPGEVVSELAKNQLSPERAGIEAIQNLKRNEVERRLAAMTKFRAAWYGSAILGGAIAGRVSSWAATMGTIDAATALSLGMRSLTRRVLANPRSAELFWQAINNKKMAQAGSVMADSFAALAADRGKKAMGIPQQISGEDQAQ